MIHNGIIENFATLQGRADRRRRRLRQPDRHRGGRAPAGRRVRPRPSDLAEAMRAVCPPARGRLHAAGRARRRPRRRGRRPAQLPAGRRRRRGRELPRLGRRRVHRAHPRGGRARPGPGRRRSPPTVDDHRLRREPVEGRHYHVDWDAAAAEKGGYPNFMAKEINEQPQAVADTLLGRTDAARQPGAGRAAHRRGGAARDRQDRHRGLRHRRPTPGMVAKYAIEHWCRIPCEVELAQRVPLPRPGGRTAGRWWWRSRSPARRWTR